MEKSLRELLLKDLCARLADGVKCQTKNGIGTLISIECSFGENLAYVDFGRSEAEEYDLNEGDTVKPYLRPMSSMTEEEYNEYALTFDNVTVYSGHNNNNIHSEHRPTYETFDYLNSIHVDYRDLIPKGLALEASKDMYKNI